MRWEALFADLESQWEAARREDDEARLADLTEFEMGRTTLSDRLRARLGAVVRLRLSDGTDLTGVVIDAAPAWLLLRVESRSVLVPVSAVATAGPLGPVAPEAGTVEARLTIAHVLRAVAREGAQVRVRVPGAALLGRIVRVGADHLDVVPDGGAAVTVALAALVAVESTA